MVNSTNYNWARRFMRLDPYHLPHSVLIGKDGNYSYKIDRNGAVIKRKLGCGLPVSMALPQKAFKGVAAKAIDDGNGKTIFILELHHHDVDCCLPVLVADNLDDIGADWHAWSRLMRLPMLLVDEQNMAKPVRKQLGILKIETSVERRNRLSMNNHRPWFLRKRKSGTIGKMEKLSAAEIIARN